MYYKHTIYRHTIFLYTYIMTSLTGKHSISPISSPRPNWWPMRSNQDFSSQVANVSSWRRVEPRQGRFTMMLTEDLIDLSYYNILYVYIYIVYHSSRVMYIMYMFILELTTYDKCKMLNLGHYVSLLMHFYFYFLVAKKRHNHHNLLLFIIDSLVQGAFERKYHFF